MGGRFTFMQFACKCAHPRVLVSLATALAVAGVMLACGTVLELGDGDPAVGTEAGGSVDGDAPSTCAITVNQTRIDLGDTLVGQRVTTSLRLENASGVPVTVSAILTGPPNAGFDVVPSLVVPVGSAELTVGFTGNVNGLAAGVPPPASLKLAWGKGCSLPDIPLHARTVTTSYAIAPGSIDFTARCGQTAADKEVVIQGFAAGAAWTALSTPTPPPFTIAGGAAILGSPTRVPVTAVVRPAAFPGTAAGSIVMTVTDTSGGGPVTKAIPVTVTSLGARITFMPGTVSLSAGSSVQVKVHNEGNEPATLLFFEPTFNFSPASMTVAGGAVGMTSVSRKANNTAAGSYIVNVSPSGVAPCHKESLTINYDP